MWTPGVPYSGGAFPQAAVRSVNRVTGADAAGRLWNPLSVGGTWAGGDCPSSSSILDAHDRLRPEKRTPRPPVQRMTWRGEETPWTGSLAGDLAASTPPWRNDAGSSLLPPESLSRVSSMTIADLSPRLALKKVLLFYEAQDYTGAATFISRLTPATFRLVWRELPVDVLLENMPSTLPIFTSLYPKVLGTEGESVSRLKADTLLTHLVALLSSPEQHPVKEEEFREKVKPLLNHMMSGEVGLLRRLRGRRRALEKAVEGMGQHGLVGTTDHGLLPLHEALRQEIRRVVSMYKEALSALDHLSLAPKAAAKGVVHGPAPIQASHQRQLSLKAEEVEERVIKNKSLLNVVERTWDNAPLDVLVSILQRRVQADKEVLFHFTELRREAGTIIGGNGEPGSTLVAPLLMQFSRASREIEDLMSQVCRETGREEEEEEDQDDSSDLSGYHSDSDSAVMTSGNSPFVSPKARFNFLSRSVRSKGSVRPSLFRRPSSDGRPMTTTTSRDESSPTVPTRPRTVKHRNQLAKSLSSERSWNSSGGTEGSSWTGSDESEERVACVDCVTVVSVPDDQVLSQGLNHVCLASGGRESEVADLRHRLLAAQATIRRLEEDRIAHATLQEKPVDTGRVLIYMRMRSDDANRSVARNYGALYATVRIETMDALDSLTELAGAEELKAKLLFSVIVLAFRAVDVRASRVREALGDMGNGNIDVDTELLHHTLAAFLRVHPERGDLDAVIADVGTQLWSTLYDYPTLRECAPLKRYISSAVHLAWQAATLRPAIRLEYEGHHFRPDLHVRFPGSDPSKDEVRTWLWPALLALPNGPCLHKGVVFT